MGPVFDIVWWHTKDNPIFSNPLAREAYLHAVGRACNHVRFMERDIKRVMLFEQVLNEEYHHQLAILLERQAEEE